MIPSYPNCSSEGSGTASSQGIQISSGTNELAVLYLAKHTPMELSVAPGPHPSLGVTPVYHYEVWRALTELGFKVEPARSLDRLVSGPRNYDYVFSLYNKAPFNHSEVFVSAVCEYLRVPYLGARPHTRAIAEDKHLTKLMAIHLGIAVPDWKIYRRESLSAKNPPAFPGPYFIKPRCGAGSLGIDGDSLQEEWPQIRSCIERIHQNGDDAIVEQFIAGDNVTVPVLGGDPPSLLPPIETSSPTRGGVMTRRQKKLLDPTLSRVEYTNPEHRPSVEAIALRVYGELEPIDYMRVDFRVPSAPESRPYLLEVNVCCNLGSHASIAHAARSAGMSQKDLISKILEHSFRRQNVGG
jgi:D-alanine-D-alanine ligase